MNKAFSLFAWGSSSFNVEVLKKQKLFLPITTNGEIDFSFMDSFIAELETERTAELEAYLKVAGLDNYELTTDELQFLKQDFSNITWGDYLIGDLFDRVKTKKLPYKAKDLPSESIDSYNLPCLTSSFNNQGLNYYCPKTGATILKHLISIPSNSDVYRAYYQPSEFTVLSDAYAISWKDKHKIITGNQYLFMVMCINKVTNLPIYSYKNKLGGWNVVKNKHILLPLTANGEINFEIMDKIIQALKKLVIKDVVLYADNKINATKKVINNKTIP